MNEIIQKKGTYELRYHPETKQYAIIKILSESLSMPILITSDESLTNEIWKKIQFRFDYQEKNR